MGVAPHILLISVSIVVSVGTPSARAPQPRVERDHPSSCPPFRSRPTLPPRDRDAHLHSPDFLLPKDSDL